MALPLATLLQSARLKLSSKLFTAGALNHVKKHWAKYATAGFVGEEILSNTLLRDTVKADNPSLSDDDIELIVSEIEGFVEDMRADQVLMSDAVRSGDRTPKGAYIPLTGDNKGKIILTEQYYGKSYVQKLKNAIRNARRRTAVWRRYTRNNWQRK